MRRLAFLLLVTACNGESNGPCVPGDPIPGAEMELVIRVGDARDAGSVGEVIPLADGDDAPMYEPPQGGNMIFPAARVRGLEGVSDPYIKGELIDQCNGQIVHFEKRPAGLREASDGWFEPRSTAIGDFVNLPVCPGVNLTRDLEDEPYRLRVSFVSQSNRCETTYVSKEIMVVPRCAEEHRRDQCICECDGNYRIEDDCVPEPDAGAPPGTCPGETPDAGVPAIDGGAP